MILTEEEDPMTKEKIMSIKLTENTKDISIKEAEKEAGKNKKRGQTDESETAKVIQINEGQKDALRSMRKLSGEKRKQIDRGKLEQERTSKHLSKKGQTSYAAKGKGKACITMDENSDSDFENPKFLKTKSGRYEAGKDKAKKKRNPLKLKDPLSAKSQRAQGKQPAELADTPVNPEPDHQEPDSPEDAETVKKEIAMELNEKFALLMTTKVDMRNLIRTAKEMFPDDEMFEQYENELLVLFNEQGLGMSSGKRSKGMNSHHTTGETSNAQRDDTHTTLARNARALCTPTKLKFDGEVSLDAVNPLSPYWYSQTTYGLIDETIMNQSGGATEITHNPMDNVKSSELPVVAYVPTSPVDRDLIDGSPEIPIPSFNLGISQHMQCDYHPATKNVNDPITSNDDQAKPLRRQIKIGEQILKMQEA
ncbi:hypothetical protein L6452_16787 [Arctium lappa]|uniref:Uncharacterized protein n=1 Tax=Arctium lappa TaxID=4217 RepID=A0ACB9C1X0_ARCLA|nr:hypothetical protein L6452_16787 [Arctium lappa]